MMSAGCGGVSILTDDSSPTPTTVPGTDTITPSPTESKSVQSLYSMETETGEIVLRLSDLGATYNLSGESLKVRKELSGEERDQLESNDILRTHSRSFRSTNSSEENNPLLVISTVTIYDSQNDAKSGLQHKLKSFQERDSEIRNVSVATGINATQVKFQNQRDLHNTLLYHQDNNLVITVIVTGPNQYYTEEGRSSLVQMYSEIS